MNQSIGIDAENVCCHLHSCTKFTLSAVIFQAYNTDKTIFKCSFAG